ncbi:NAD(P)/FAD-dependent oxidoreductase [Haloglycomyces albus]|uniref:NAD(P)/FAD-dependent oxidoreductase n=1 Tax=Haloglycomyces albus TaxID=526067 RepID=UPI00046D0E5B|nr:NAD(P)/FAD-dependent oxidoreductase [Haloglycomyces albus]
MKRIVVIGAGHVGLYVAERLGKKLKSEIKKGQVEVMVIDRNQHMTYQPLLPEAAAGSLSPRHAIIPLRSVLKSCTLVTGEVTRIQHSDKTVTVQPATGPAREIEYDDIVVAPGSVSRPLPVPGLAENAIGFKSIGEAIWLRSHILSRFDVAASTEDPEVRKAALRFVTIGGGFAGCEAMAEMQDACNAIIKKRYPELDPDEMEWYLIEATGRIMPEVGPEMGAYAARQLTKRGVDVRLETVMKSCENGHVVLADGDEFDCDTIIWTAGVMPTPMLKDTDFPLGPKGHIMGNTRLQVIEEDVEDPKNDFGRPIEGAWAAGDSAQIPDTSDFPIPYCTPSAQHAVRQAQVLADNVYAKYINTELKAYEHKYIGSVAGLGLYKGVAHVYGMKVRGFMAWLMHRGYHLMKVPGTSRKARILVDWIVTSLSSREMAQLSEIEEGRRPFEAIASGGKPYRPVDHGTD